LQLSAGIDYYNTVTGTEVGMMVIIHMQGGPKNVPTCFCQNFIKSPPNLPVFATRMVKTTALYEVHSFSTSRNLC